MILDERSYDPSQDKINSAVNDDDNPINKLWWEVNDAISELSDAGAAVNYVHYKYARLKEAMRIFEEARDKAFPR